MRTTIRPSTDMGAQGIVKQARTAATARGGALVLVEGGERRRRMARGALRQLQAEGFAVWPVDTAQGLEAHVWRPEVPRSWPVIPGGGAERPVSMRKAGPLEHGLCATTVTTDPTTGRQRERFAVFVGEPMADYRPPVSKREADTMNNFIRERWQVQVAAGTAAPTD